MCIHTRKGMRSGLIHVLISRLIGLKSAAAAAAFYVGVNFASLGPDRCELVGCPTEDCHRDSFDEACRFRVKATDHTYLIKVDSDALLLLISLEHTGLTMMPLSDTKGYTAVNVQWGWKISMRRLPTFIISTSSWRERNISLLPPKFQSFKISLGGTDSLISNNLKH